MKTVVLGSGGWGTALSQVLCDNGHDVTLWSHNPDKAAAMAESRENPLLPGVHLPDALRITGDLACLEGAEMVVCASAVLRCAADRAQGCALPAAETVLVSVSKGIERDTNLRMSQILQEETKNICKVVALSGPSHAEEVVFGCPRLRVRLHGPGCGAVCPGRLYE